METFVELKKLVQDPDYMDRRKKYQNSLDLNVIDKPIRKIIECFSNLESCFTLQSCFGHFVYGKENDIHNIKPLPNREIPGSIEYRIAYIALCVQNNEEGQRIVKTLKNIAGKNPAYIQFGSAEWFWERSVNSVVIQVEPERFKTLDKIVTNYHEAIKIQKEREMFFEEIESLVCINMQGIR
jgi:hypothetical protein